MASGKSIASFLAMPPARSTVQVALPRDARGDRGERAHVDAATQVLSLSFD